MENVLIGSILLRLQRPPPLPSRTNWTRLVPRPVLTGHVSPLLRLQVFLWSTIVSTVLGLTQLLVVFRWNLALGIPDAVHTAPPPPPSY